jgi:hypothetical protein
MSSSTCPCEWSSNFDRLNDYFPSQILQASFDEWVGPVGKLPNLARPLLVEIIVHESPLGTRPLRQTAFSSFCGISLQRVNRVASQATQFGAASAIGLHDQVFVEFRAACEVQFRRPFRRE